ncbi:rod shape-determining protein MreD [Streptococcus cuniculipharyngis]|nr:rod shape-determining protein MreD [Streptococcus cuniculipharyngis]
MKNKWLFPLFLFFLLLIDGQVSYLLSDFLGENSRINSHLILLALLCHLQEDDSPYLYWLYFMLGLIFDLYYVNMFGMASLIFPCLIFLIRKMGYDKEVKFFQGLMVFIIMNFVFEIMIYGLASLYQLTTYPFLLFITYNLAPTLLYNIFLYLIFQLWKSNV